jgi:hypothetical protein
MYVFYIYCQYIYIYMYGQTRVSNYLVLEALAHSPGARPARAAATARAWLLCAAEPCAAASRRAHALRLALTSQMKYGLPDAPAAKKRKLDKAASSNPAAKAVRVSCSSADAPKNTRRLWSRGTRRLSSRGTRRLVFFASCFARGLGPDVRFVPNEQGA